MPLAPNITLCDKFGYTNANSRYRCATDYGRQHGITVIDGGCPLMFAPTADFGHKIMRFVYAGKVPKQV